VKTVRRAPSPGVKDSFAIRRNPGEGGRRPGEGDVHSRPQAAFRRRRRNRRGLSALEVVITLGVTFPIAMALYFLGRDACARLFYIVDSLVSWPFL
jgi:hypothetical protein